MAGLVEKISELAREKKIDEITIASEEGLPMVSTAENADEESAEGVQEIQKRLAGSDMKYLTIVDEKGMKFLYHDGGLYYIIRNQDLLDERTIKSFGDIINEDLREKEEEMRKRSDKAKEKKEEREKRAEKAKEKKEEREQRIEKSKEKDEKREQRIEEIKRRKEERKKRTAEIRRRKEERKKITARKRT